MCSSTRRLPSAVLPPRRTGAYPRQSAGKKNDGTKSEYDIYKIITLLSGRKKKSNNSAQCGTGNVARLYHCLSLVSWVYKYLQIFLSGSAEVQLRGQHRYLRSERLGFDIWCGNRLSQNSLLKNTFNTLNLQNLEVPQKQKLFYFNTVTNSQQKQIHTQLFAQSYIFPHIFLTHTSMKKNMQPQ